MAGMTFRRLHVVVHRILWECRRVGRRWLRRFGWGGTVLILGIAMLVSGGLQLERAGKQLSAARLELRALDDSPHAHSPAGGSNGDSRERLRAFDAYLAAHDDIPDTLQNLFRLAEAEKLRLQRGEYKVEPDQHGGFVRYRMMLPVKGDSQAIYRFMLAALQAHKTLALDSVQFRRERIGAKDVEARVHWVLLTRPAGPSPARPVSMGGGH